jgi:hypothetical protein
MMASWGFKHVNVIKLYQALEPIKTRLGLINMGLAELDPLNPLYVRRMEEFDHAMVLLSQGKWAASRAMITQGKDDWKQAFRLLERSAQFADRLLARVSARSDEPIPFEAVPLASQGTEIAFADGTPLLPSISPVVILQGSDFEMGYQYAQQLVQIFGPWILERKAGRSFSSEQLSVIKRWEQEIRQYAPEMLPLCEGWAQGATDAGVSMTYYDVLDLWTGHEPPLTGYFGEKGLPELGMPWCSGNAAWGRATIDGKLVTASSGDHDPTFTVTVIALPETGHRFMFCPFGATGDIPKGGPIFMFGHPGMNSAGLAYVHHGGGPKWAERKEAWGYGLRRAVSVFHVLRFASSAREALEMEMAMPISDIGRGDLGHPGGFYADSDYGYILEGRKDPVIRRESGVMGETDFLYSANAPMHPDIAQTPWMRANREQWSYDEHGGWFPARASAKINFQTIMTSFDAPHIIGLQFATFNSRHRARYMFKTLNAGVGRIDFDYMTMMFRQAGAVPHGTHKEMRHAYEKGEWGDISCGNATNALVVVTKPSEGLFAHCVGPARRGLPPMSPKTFANPMYDETNTFWELKLEATPEAVADYAGQVASQAIGQAHDALTRHPSLAAAARARLEGLLDRAEAELAGGQRFAAAAQSGRAGEAVCDWARAVRAYTRAQVRARQVLDTLVPPARSAAELATARRALEPA